jgi:carbon storage regulator
MELMTMLVLSRKKSEVIRIGDDITVMVVRIGPDSVRIGIEAPRNVVIVRDDAKKQEREVSSGSVS